MSNRLNDLKTAAEALDSEERRILRQYLEHIAPHQLEMSWDIEASVILDAIGKSSDLTKRGLRGILAEAIFERDIVSSLGDGWTAGTIDRDKDLSYDSLLVRGTESVRVQVKLQRSEKGIPKLYYPKHYEEGSLYVVEVQKTRSGTVVVKEPLPGSEDTMEVTRSTTEDTRPYRFGQFDILAVSMHPLTRNWREFRYTLGDWLLPRAAEPSKIEVLQPVAMEPNDVWTDDLATCLRWLQRGEKKTVLAELKHIRQKKNNI